MTFNFFKIFKSSDKRLKAIKRQQALARRKIEREVVALVSRGNISLQQGEYITKEGMDTLQDELTEFFSSTESEW